MTEENDSHFVLHMPCPACGSSDANALYSDGHAVCFKCKTYQRAAGEVPSTQARNRPSMLLDVQITALPKRRLTAETCEKFGYGLAEHKGVTVQVAPYFNKAGELVGQKLRGPNKSFSWLGSAKEAVLFGQHLWRDSGRKVVITEGELDAMSLSQMQGNKYPVVSIPSGAQSAKGAILGSLEWLEQFEDVIFMFDQDEEGKKAAAECALLLTPGRAKIATLPLKDASDCLVAGKFKEALDAIWAAKVYRPDGIVAGEEIWEHMTRADRIRGALFPHSGLNEKTLGMRAGEIITFTAGTGAGKSTFVLETAFALALIAKEKVGIIALENPVKRTALDLAGMALNINLRLAAEQPSQDVMRGVFETTIRDGFVFYDHWGSVDSDHLLAKIRFMARGEGCNYIVLDHISIMTSGLDGDNERRDLDILMTKLTTIAQELGIVIMIVCHLRKSGGKPHEEGEPVRMSDLRGSNGIAQLSHTIIAVERNQQDADVGNIALLRVLKARYSGRLGVAGHLRWDEATGRLLEHSMDFESEPLPEVVAEKDY